MPSYKSENLKSAVAAIIFPAARRPSPSRRSVARDGRRAKRRLLCPDGNTVPMWGWACGRGSSPRRVPPR